MTFILFLMAMITGCGKKGGDTGPNPQLNFTDITVNEGNGGAGSIEIKLTLNRAPSKQVTVTYSTFGQFDTRRRSSIHKFHLAARVDASRYKIKFLAFFRCPARAEMRLQL